MKELYELGSFIDGRTLQRNPIPVPAAAMVVGPSDQIDECFHSAVPVSAPVLDNAAIQAELLALKQQYQQALALLAQKDIEIASKNAELEQKNAALETTHKVLLDQNKDLRQKDDQLGQLQTKLTTTEQEVTTLREQRFLFFSMNKAMLEQCQKFAALETSSVVDQKQGHN